MEQINLDTGNGNKRDEGLDGFVVLGGKSSVVFELVDGIFGEESCCVKELVVRDGSLTVGLGRDDSGACLLHDTFTYGVAVVSLVLDDSLGALDTLPEQGQGLGAIGSLAAGDDVMQGVTESIAEQVYLTAEAALPPRAPAACSWARTTVESIMSHSQSAKRSRKLSKILSHRPSLLQRPKRV